MTVPFHPSLTSSHVMIDVRSPAEFAHGHIPGAVNMPLFSDAERADVGTLYVQQGKDVAVEQGLHYVGPKLSSFVATARTIANGKPLLVYCWRGGMRSSSMSWLLQTAGLDVVTLQRGYKGYRAHVLATLALPWKLRVVVGPTGSGKTAFLHQLTQRGEQVLDLEGIAHHKGSAFGALGEQPQPTTEHAMNCMHAVLAAFNIEQTVWVEDESRMIGTVCIPEAFFETMQQAEFHEVTVPIEERIANLVQDYGRFTPEQLMASFAKIRTKLGGEWYAAAVAAVQAGDLETAVRIALTYYDATYAHCLARRTTIKTP